MTNGTWYMVENAAYYIPDAQPIFGTQFHPEVEQFTAYMEMWSPL